MKVLFSSPSFGGGERGGGAIKLLQPSLLSVPKNMATKNI